MTFMPDKFKTAPAATRYYLSAFLADRFGLGPFVLVNSHGLRPRFRAGPDGPTFDLFGHSSLLSRGGRPRASSGRSLRNLRKAAEAAGGIVTTSGKSWRGRMGRWLHNTGNVDWGCDFGVSGSLITKCLPNANSSTR